MFTPVVEHVHVPMNAVIVLLFTYTRWPHTDPTLWPHEGASLCFLPWPLFAVEACHPSRYTPRGKLDPPANLIILSFPFPAMSNVALVRKTSPLMDAAAMLPVMENEGTSLCFLP